MGSSGSGTSSTGGGGQGGRGGAHGSGGNDSVTVGGGTGYAAGGNNFEMFSGQQRSMELGTLRREIWIQTMKLMTDQLERPMTAPLTKQGTAFDDAVTAYVDKLRQPETCYVCGQVLPHRHEAQQ